MELPFIALYFLPSFIAALRHHHSGTAIFVLNLLLGWTALGWIIALVWSFTGVPRAIQLFANTIYSNRIGEQPPS